MVVNGRIDVNWQLYKNNEIITNTKYYPAKLKIKCHVHSKIEKPSNDQQKKAYMRTNYAKTRANAHKSSKEGTNSKVRCTQQYTKRYIKYKSKLIAKK